MIVAFVAIITFALGTLATMVFYSIWGEARITTMTTYLCWIALAIGGVAYGIALLADATRFKQQKPTPSKLDWDQE